MSHHRNFDPRNPANAAAMRSFEMQNKIRQGTLQMNDRFADLARWEKTIKKKDAELERSRGTATQPKTKQGGSRGAAPAAVRQRRPAPIRGAARGQGNTTRTVHTRMGGGAVSAPIEELQKQQGRAAATSSNGGDGGGRAKPSVTSAASHTYDKGYKKWEKFDVDAALEEVEVEDVSPEDAATLGNGAADDGGAAAVAAAAGGPVPAHVVSGDKPKEPVYVARTRAPVRSAPSDLATILAEERAKGNAHFAKGEFHAAIRCYTKCIGYDSRIAGVYSNRAAAFLKTKEYLKARSDCDSALRLEPQHSKALLRRATANNFLGRHRAALRDLTVALAAAPSSKRLKSELQKTKELHRTSIRKAPRWSVDVSFAAGPSLPTPATARREQLEATGSSSNSSSSSKLAASAKPSGLKPINARDDMEEVPINRRKKEQQQRQQQEEEAAAAAKAKARQQQQQREREQSQQAAPAAAAAKQPPESATARPAAESTEPASVADATDAPPHPASAARGGEADDTAATTGEAGGHGVEARAPATPAQQAAAAAARTAAAASARWASIEKMSNPKSSYEFLNCWNGLRDDRERAHYLRQVPTKNLKAVFKAAPDADVFSAVLAALVLVAEGSAGAGAGSDNGGGGGGIGGGVAVAAAKPKPKRAVVYLQKLAASRRFGMAVMLFSDADRAAVRCVLAAADAKAGDKASELAAKFGV